MEALAAHEDMLQVLGSFTGDDALVPLLASAAAWGHRERRDIIAAFRSWREWMGERALEQHELQNLRLFLGGLRSSGRYWREWGCSSGASGTEGDDWW